MAKRKPNLTRYEFEQMLAEAMDHYGILIGTLQPLIEAAAHRYGWPIPEQHLDAAMRMIMQPLLPMLQARATKQRLH